MSYPAEIKPKLSIVIVTYNAAEHLPATLRSLEEQTVDDLGEFEVVAVDGNSKDSTLQILENFPMIEKIISEPDKGIYDAMNKGANLASGSWIQFLNAGDTFSGPQALGTALRNLHKADSQGLPWLIAGAQNLGGTSGVIRRIPNIPHVWWRHAYGLQPHCHQATWFRRSTFLDSGTHSDKFGTAGDFDVILRFGLLASPLVIREILIDYMGGGVSEVSPMATAYLQHKVRAERFNLNKPLGALDRILGMALASVNFARIRGGRLKAATRRAHATSTD